MSFPTCCAVCSFVSVILCAAILPTSSTATGPVPFYDGRLVLHFAEELEYSPEANYIGVSGNPACEEVATQVPAGQDIAIVYVIAAFPRNQSPELGRLSFAVQYDPGLLEIIDHDVNAYIAEQSGDWPGPESSIHLRWDPKPRGRSVEVMWFAVRQLTGEPALLALSPGRFGGEFGNDWMDWRIDGFGTLGFGQEGDANCPDHGICCIPGEDCALLTELWCQVEQGEFLGLDQSCADCSPVGACCDGYLCFIRAEAQCVARGWDYAGDGTSCDPNVCVPLGACCAPDGSCAILGQNQCEPASFVPGATCDPAPCAELGACCYFDYTTCLLATEEACIANGSEYLGDGTICMPESCFPGVCCVPGDVEACMYSTPEECEKVGGAYNLGAWGSPDEVCWNICCCGPTIDSSWGTVKSRFRDPSR